MRDIVVKVLGHSEMEKVLLEKFYSYTNILIQLHQLFLAFPVYDQIQKQVTKKSLQEILELSLSRLIFFCD